MNTRFDIERMRKTWHEMDKTLTTDTPDENPNQFNNRQTSLDKLRNRYLRATISGIIAAVLFSMLLFHMPSLTGTHRYYAAASFALLMLVNAAITYRFWRGVSKIDPVAMSIHQVSSLSLYYKKWHLRYNLIIFPIGMVWIAYFIYLLRQSAFRSVDSIITGGLIGCICGLYALRKYLADYKKLSEYD